VKEQAPPLVPVLAALPVCACMAILGLPALADSYAVAFRALYFAACMVWLVPLALLQRALTVPGRLDIRVERAGTRLAIDVRNDGVRPDHAAGMPRDDGGGGIGLANVAERLRHLYGDDQQIAAGWGADDRFHVRLALPLRLAAESSVPAAAERMAA